MESRIKVGDVPLRRLAERTESFMVGTVERRSGQRRVQQETVSANNRLLSAIVWDLVDNAEGQWHTVQLDTVLRPLLYNALFTVTVVGLPHATAESADELLRSAPGYEGALEIDLGNPVQLRAFALGLIDMAVIHGRSVFVRSEDAEIRSPPIWTTKIKFDSVTALLDYEIAEVPPVVHVPSEMSMSGKRTAELLAANQEVTAKSRLLEHLCSMHDVTEEGGFSEVRLRLADEPSLYEAEVPENKLVRYALSLDHPEGKHKAVLFRDLLGIQSEDWRYLAAQLLRGLATAEVTRVRFSPYGVKYSADIPVLGLNGNTKMVTTGWISIADGPAKLTTALIAGRGSEMVGVAVAPPVIASDLVGDARFQAIYDAAVREAQERATRTVPVPMKVAGYPVEREGACGFAGVRIVDARSAFVRWLRNHGIGEKHYQRGWYLPAAVSSQSLDRSRAYAAGFADVLRLNGIACDTEWAFD